jgi:hypothetical protein
MTDADEQDSEQDSEQAGTDDEQGEQFERHGPGTVLDLTLPYARVSANVVREWARAVLVPPALKRLYEMGMGVTKFATPTAAGNVISIEAPPAVQRAALSAVIGIGVPAQVGLIGETDERPGVLALGEWDDVAGASPLDQARAEAHAGMRGMGAIASGGIEVTDHSPSSPASSPAPTYSAPVGHEVIEVVEDSKGDAKGTDDTRADELRPTTHSLADARAALAAQILAKRRNGSNGSNGNGTSHSNGTH